MAKILDNQITGGVLPLGYQAHLVTLQVNLQPNGRNLPYDTFVDVTLFPGSWSDAMNAAADVNSDPQALPPVMVYPLIITDAMESASVGRSLEVIRQAALQLSGIVANAGVSLGLGGGSDRLESILGSDRNSLVTLGRVSDHTVRVRLGAQAQGSTRLALVPRTHNVSLVVFTKANEKSYIEKLSVITRSSFVDVDTGVALLPKSGRRQELAGEVRNLITAYGFQLESNCDTHDRPDGPLELLRAADRADYLYIGKCLREKPEALPDKGKSLSALKGAAETVYERAKANFASLKGLPAQPSTSVGDGGEKFTELSPSQEAQLKRVLAGLVNLQSESRFAKFLVQLTPYKPPQLPPVQQLVVLRDDKKSTSTTIRGGKNLDPKKLSAKLHLSTPDLDDLVLLSTQVAVDADGAVTLTFPSLADNEVKLKPVTPPPDRAKNTASTKSKAQAKAKPDTETKEPAKLVPPRIELVYTTPKPKETADAIPSSQDKQLRVYGEPRLTPDPSPTSSSSAPKPQDTGVAEFKTVKYLQDEEKGTSNPVSTTSSLLVADGGGNARLTLMVGELKAPITLRVTGADVRSIDPKAEFAPKTKSFTVASSGVVTMALGNLSPARAVQIETLADGTAQGSTIVLTVEPARGRGTQ
ncbi:hypothetical protein LZ009_09340 [Ramlibacter sp. XY19]|uniref:hypothetical protein n=1 Tax=Ramlibacter paludis TaxID=2908000 RepID=UPI0023DAB03A|nr:hypothetical protein [Ramlibacter paludis]MCG2592983.1 hypothetical protein [Ramlibacter paludis]